MLSLWTKSIIILNYYKLFNNRVNRRALLLSELRGAMHFYLKGPFNTLILFSLLFGMKGLNGCHDTCN